MDTGTDMNQFPCPLEIFIKYSNAVSVAEYDIKHYCRKNNLSYEEKLNDDQYMKTAVRNVYKNFYKTPHRREKLPLRLFKLKACPQHVKDMILKIPSSNNICDKDKDKTGSLKTKQQLSAKKLQDNENCDVNGNCESANVLPEKEPMEVHSTEPEPFTSNSQMGAIIDTTDNDEFPCKFETFLKHTNARSIAELKVKRFCRKNNLSFEEKKNDKKCMENALRDVYLEFYKTPNLRWKDPLRQLKIKPCPQNIKNIILNIPAECVKYRKAQSKRQKIQIELDTEVTCKKRRTLSNNSLSVSCSSSVAMQFQLASPSSQNSSVVTVIENNTKILTESNFKSGIRRFRSYVMGQLSKYDLNDAEIELLFERIQNSIYSTPMLIEEQSQPNFTSNVTTTQPNNTHRVDDSHQTDSLTNHRGSCAVSISRKMSETDVTTTITKPRGNDVIPNLINSTECKNKELNQKLQPYPLYTIMRLSRGIKRKILSAIFEMKLGDFCDYTNIKDFILNKIKRKNMQPEEIDKELNEHYISIILEKNTWPTCLNFQLHNLLKYLHLKGILIESLSLKDISPKLLSCGELRLCTNFDFIVQRNYLVTRSRMLSSGDLSIVCLETYKQLCINETWLDDMQFSDGILSKYNSNVLSEDVDNDFMEIKTGNNTDQIDTDQQNHLPENDSGSANDDLSTEVETFHDVITSHIDQEKDKNIGSEVDGTVLDAAMIYAVKENDKRGNQRVLHQSMINMVQENEENAKKSREYKKAFRKSVNLVQENNENIMSAEDARTHSAIVQNDEIISQKTDFVENIAAQDPNVNNDVLEKECSTENQMVNSKDSIARSIVNLVDQNNSVDDVPIPPSEPIVVEEETERKNKDGTVLDDTMNYTVNQKDELISLTIEHIEAKDANVSNVVLENQCSTELAKIKKTKNIIDDLNNSVEEEETETKKEDANIMSTEDETVLDATTNHTGQQKDKTISQNIDLAENIEAKGPNVNNDVLEKACSTEFVKIKEESFSLSDDYQTENQVVKNQDDPFYLAGSIPPSDDFSNSVELVPISLSEPIVIEDDEPTVENLVDILMNPREAINICSITSPVSSLAAVSAYKSDIGFQTEFRQAQRLPSSIENSNSNDDESVGVVCQQSVQKFNKCEILSSITTKVESKLPILGEDVVAENVPTGITPLPVLDVHPKAFTSSTRSFIKKPTAKQSRKKSKTTKNEQVPQRTHEFRSLPVTVKHVPTKYPERAETITKLSSVKLNLEHEHDLFKAPSSDVSIISSSDEKHPTSSQMLALDCSYFFNSQIKIIDEELNAESKPKDIYCDTISLRKAYQPKNFTEKEFIYRSLWELHLRWDPKLKIHKDKRFQIVASSYLARKVFQANINVGQSKEHSATVLGLSVLLLFNKITIPDWIDIFQILKELKTFKYHYREEPQDCLLYRSLYYLFYTATKFSHWCLKYEYCSEQYAFCEKVTPTQRRPHKCISSAISPNILNAMRRKKLSLSEN